MTKEYCKLAKKEHKIIQTKDNTVASKHYAFWQLSSKFAAFDNTNKGSVMYFGGKKTSFIIISIKVFDKQEDMAAVTEHVANHHVPKQGKSKGNAIL